LLNKTMGDAVMAIFNFPITCAEHAQKALLAARQIQQNWKARSASLNDELASDGVGVGIGIDSGALSFGEFGRTHQDITAIGTVVNLAARAQAAAASGEILVTNSVREKAPDVFAATVGRDYKLKGFDEPKRLWAA
jgi:class 3 adenylate cyclase